MTSKNIKGPIHFIGIGGTGMSPLAEHCLARHFRITGSDMSENLATERLEQAGVRLWTSHEASHIGDAKTVVYSTAIKSDNPELLAARASEGCVVWHRSDLLAELMCGFEQITVTGTHGKTTTSALITHMLTALGADPSAAVGGRMLNFDSYARVGSGRYFVAEADESDGSLLKYSPTVACLTNVDADHMDYFGTMDAVKKMYQSYLQKLPTDGCAVVGWDNRHVRDICAHTTVNKLAYGSMIGCDLRLVDAQLTNGRLHIEVMVERDRVRAALPLLGLHNAQNAMCALAVARALELNVWDAAESFASFAGVARRMSLVHEDKNIRIFDDYAHNPGKIEACITAVRGAFPDAMIRVIFQPHRYSRLRTMMDGFAAAFSDASEVIITKVYSAGEPVDEQFDEYSVSKAIELGSSVPTIAASTFDQAIHHALKPSKQQMIILTVGAGDVWSIGRSIKDLLLNAQDK